MVGEGGAEDGGESLAPQVVAEADDEDDDEDLEDEIEEIDEVVPAQATPAKPAEKAADKASEPSVEIPPEEIFLEEEIIIEVD
jgi:hypothetical protein